MCTISLWSLAIVAIILILFQLSIFTHYEIYGIVISDIITVTIFGSVSVAGFIVSKKYSFSNIFGKSYFAYGLGGAFLFLGELSYIVYEFLGIDPYPSFADMFIFAMYICFIYHVEKNVRFFGVKNLQVLRLPLVIIPACIAYIYLIISLDIVDKITFELIYGILFVCASSLLLSFTLIGAIVFRHNVLSSTWTLLTIGLFLFTAADVWYYHVEVMSAYDYAHPVNSLWVGSACIMIYALKKHLEVL